MGLAERWPHPPGTTVPQGDRYRFVRSNFGERRASCFWRTVVLERRRVLTALATTIAAASLKNALDEVNDLFAKQSGIKIVASYAASSALMKQIEQGAPADVFLSADVDWMDYGAKHDLIKNDTRENLLGNRLVLIAAKNSKIGSVTIAPGFDLAALAG